MSEHLILVVEDNEKNLKLVRDILQYEGFDVMEARTAEDGVALATERLPDLVLMDVQLPGMDGVEALRRLRRRSATASMPVVAVTALAMKDDRARLLEAGFDGYLEKPISARALGDQVRVFLDGREAVT
jgi:two-component system, cell cycle response regulator DivK